MTPERVEVITSVERRRHWSVAEKLRLVGLSYRAVGGVAEVADRAGVHRSLLQRWRSQARRGELVEQRIGVEHFVPVAVHGDDRGAAAMAGMPAPGFPSPVPRALVEIELPNGCRLRVEPDIPSATLRRIIGVLVRR